MWVTLWGIRKQEPHLQSPSRHLFSRADRSRRLFFRLEDKAIVPTGRNTELL